MQSKNVDPYRRRNVVASFFIALITALSPVGVTAEEIWITAGSFSWPNLELQGDRGFSLITDETWRPQVYDDCLAGGRNACRPGQWANLDFYQGDPTSGDSRRGTATFDGVTLTLGELVPGAFLRDGFFRSRVLLPPIAESATVRAPFIFDGVFVIRRLLVQRLPSI